MKKTTERFLPKLTYGSLWIDISNGIWIFVLITTLLDLFSSDVWDWNVYRRDLITAIIGGISMPFIMWISTYPVAHAKIDRTQRKLIIVQGFQTTNIPIDSIQMIHIYTGLRSGCNVDVVCEGRTYSLSLWKTERFAQALSEINETIKVEKT